MGWLFGLMPMNLGADASIAGHFPRIVCIITLGTFFGGGYIAGCD